jgi:hypothetical protein
MKRASSALALLAAGLLFAAPAEAGILRGIQEIVTGVVNVPLQTLAGTFNGPPVVGTAVGALQGLAGGLGLVASGALNIGFGALGLAKAVAPYALPFLL